MNQEYLDILKKVVKDKSGLGIGDSLMLISKVEEQREKLKTYAAFINGSITRSELDKVLNDD